MFKLLKFIDEYKTFQKGYAFFPLAKLDQAMKDLVIRQSVAGSHSVFENLFQLITKFSATLYYLLDNTVLLVTVLYGKNIKYKNAIKQWKDWFNLIRTWFQLFDSVMKTRRTHVKMV